MVNASTSRPVRCRRRRPPLRTYIPFMIFCCTCLAIIAGFTWLLVRLVAPGNGGTAANGGVPGGMQAAPVVIIRAVTPTWTATTVYSTPSTTPAGEASHEAPAELQAPLSPTLSIVPAANISFVTPAPHAAPPGTVQLVVARGVKHGAPVESATIFISPAYRLYAFATAYGIKAKDEVRFVFQYDGLPMPNDDVVIKATNDMPVHAFYAFADYHGGSQPLPAGHYRVLFYQHGLLQAVTPFRVG